MWALGGFLDGLIHNLFPGLLACYWILKVVLGWAFCRYFFWFFGWVFGYIFRCFFVVFGLSLKIGGSSMFWVRDTYSNGTTTTTTNATTMRLIQGIALYTNQYRFGRRPIYK
jgi:hypothetical protein